MTHACIHLGVHEHPVKDGEYQDFKERTHTLSGDQVERTPHAMNFAIMMEATKELLGELLLAPQEVPAKTMTFEELVPILDKCKYMTSLSVKNVTKFRCQGRFGGMDSITMLKGYSNWPYVQKNMFPSQGSNSNKVFIFKMSEIGPGIGMNLVRRIQLGGDLEDVWIMFDHVKRVKKWTTMACHIYGSTYYPVMTIAVCDMQLEDSAAQSVLQKNLNVVVTKHGVPKSKFKGFMVDSTQANWNAVQG